MKSTLGALDVQILRPLRAVRVGVTRLGDGASR
jgi:hypothetical protein